MVNIQDDKERLENMSPIGFDLNGNVLLSSDDYYWLKERAEYVEELEKDLDEWRNEALRWLKLFEEAQERLLETKELNKRLREALEFYADESIYSAKNKERAEITLDYGEKARKALEGTE